MEDKNKKEAMLSVRVDVATEEAIKQLAKKDDRTVAWMTRKLIMEALEARGVRDTK